MGSAKDLSPARIHIKGSAGNTRPITFILNVCRIGMLRKELYMRTLGKIEYEGLALLGIRIIQAYEAEIGCPFRSVDEIRSSMIYTEDGICLDGNDFFIEDFLLDRLILQDGVPILVVYDTREEGINISVYISMEDFISADAFDINRLMEKMYKAKN